ncbi:acyl-CoA N-acyltransferase [Aspergillus sclerotioniger CBS 115572]|uniref:Acyl-CoA N-acyltransferase n=1 Tax=Aspergillus sclerotioniger CBS 115572 TaxID=1450535 RepID=A0A317VYK4_9EURO|nr:acyl-CoA N-acyltransferase [Aspergillus sclerotioniger CBS 115572]PWY79353.1 acyl-CoA N-acyltransferase [Aspergillus sclerotioniger CBS 115572]
MATPKDVPEIIQLWYTVFSIPAMLELWPDTPGVRWWWESAIRQDMLHRPREKYLKVVDSSGGRIAAYGKWSLQSAEERGPRFPPWHPDMDARHNDRFFQVLESNRARAVGDGKRKNFYFDMLATHPDYRRMGAARLLLEWGCQVADQERALVYLDATDHGRPIYEGFGFVDRGDAQSQSHFTGLVPMLREPNGGRRKW